MVGRESGPTVDMQLEIAQVPEFSKVEFDPRVNLYQDKKRLVREVTAGRYAGTSVLDIPGRAKKIRDPAELNRLWLINRLRGIRPKTGLPVGIPEIKIVDLCCGAGGFATGIKWACESAGLRPVVSLAVDTDERARDIYKLNVRPLNVLAENVANLVDYDLSGKDPDYRPKLIDTDLKRHVGNVDLVIAGPPCEGNSTFNNHTRGRDRRNELYVATVATAIAMKAKVIIVENVMSVTGARENVVSRALSMLQVAGYKIGDNQLRLDASEFGVAQRRKRHFLIASKKRALGEKISHYGLLASPISVMDVLDDLLTKEGETPLDETSARSHDNQRRIEYLFDNDDFNLPDSERPDCHRTKKHTYLAVYGRMFPDEPSQTITTGFLSPGRGRYIHPLLRRGLTLREGARLQSFPDDYKWYRRGKEFHRNPLAALIGDAVPPQLGFTVGLMGLALM